MSDLRLRWHVGVVLTRAAATFVGALLTRPFLMTAGAEAAARFSAVVEDQAAELRALAAELERRRGGMLQSER